jgi:hypothetical protein
MRAPAFVMLALLVESAFLVALAATDGYDAARSGELWRVVATYAMVVAMFVLASSAKTRAVPFVVLVLFVAVNFARYETAGGFDFAFAYYNVRELATPLGRRIVGSHVRVHEVLLLFVLPIAAALVILKRTNATRWPSSRRIRSLLLSVCAFVVVVLPLAHVGTHETLSSFVASALRFYAESREAGAATASAPYPYLHDVKPSARALAIAGPSSPRPNVILLFLESWSELYTDEGYTPVFEAERRAGFTMDHFYGSSVQSSRGRFATLCSLYPMYREKEVFALENAPLHCLPRVMAEAGWHTMIASASDEPEFERSDSFFAQIGFGERHWEDPTERGTNPLVWGAGLRDDAFYEKFFAAVDVSLAAHPDDPIFAVAINASNHYPFDQDPDLEPVSGFPTKYGRNYVASLSAQDTRLTTFFAELAKRPALRDGIVVLVGDHSFPADEHGVHYNGLGAGEETFRTAFALRWNGHVPRTLDKRRTASQIDVAPTIADLAGLRYASHFVGRSLFAGGDEGAVAPMVQPYDGVRLVAVRWPYKLERHESAEQEHLYDLSTDPDETRDRIDDPALDDELPALREAIGRIRAHQSLALSKRIWPP